MKNKIIVQRFFFTFVATILCPFITQGMGTETRYNVLFIISDDLTATALSCYGNQVCHTPNIDAIAARGTRFTRAYCQGTYCGPSRASFMSGYYPHATGALGYKNPRPQIGDRATANHVVAMTEHAVIAVVVLTARYGVCAGDHGRSGARRARAARRAGGAAAQRGPTQGHFLDVARRNQP